MAEPVRSRRLFGRAFRCGFFCRKNDVSSRATRIFLADTLSAKFAFIAEAELRRSAKFQSYLEGGGYVIAGVEAPKVKKSCQGLTAMSGPTECLRKLSALLRHDQSGGTLCFRPGRLVKR